MNTNFLLAQPPEIVTGLLAVPPNTQSIEADFTFTGPQKQVLPMQLDLLFSSI